MGAGWCTNERCRIIELHDAHEHDFEKPMRGRPMAGQKPAKVKTPRKDSKAALLASLKPKVIRMEQRPDGPMAYVTCPECSGGGCAECRETGEMSLYRWHLWSRRC